jgi:hypothetical protein
MRIIDQHYTLSYITPLFDTQAATCFGIHVPSSGSFSYPRELLESRNVYKFQVTHEDMRSSLKMAHGCRNM